MAMFREHVAVGAIISMVVVVAVYFYALLTDPLLLVFLFAVTVAGSFLPDVDSDSGMPFYLVYGTMSLAATGMVLLYTLDSSYAADWRYLTGIPASALFFFWFVVGGIVKKCTHHRGIFHSLPATAIAALGALLVARYYGLPEEIAWIFGGGMAAGYLCHLVLDELHGGITLDGIPFNPASSGSALKLFSRSSRVNMAAYILLAALAYMVFAPQQALAFYNDSDVVEIEGEAPPTPPDEPLPDNEEGGEEGVPEDTGGSTGGSGGSSGGGSSGGGSSGGGSSGGGSSGGGAPGGEIDTEEELFELLAQAGAVSGGSGSGFFEDSVVGGSGTLSVSVDGASVRSALRGKYDLQDLLNGWRRGNDARLNARGLGLVAASTALGDSNLQGVSFTADTFVIAYRSRGYLFSIFPITFPVRVAVIPEASSERVNIRLPWYRFFVREFFTVKSLTEEVEQVVQREIDANPEAEADLKVKIFEATADFLKRKIGTVGDSVRVGT